MKTLWIEKMKKLAWKSSVKNQLRLAIVETKSSWEWSLPETADEADGSYALSLGRSVYMSFTNRTTGVSRVGPFLERVDAGGRRSCWSFLRMRRQGHIRNALFRTLRGRKLNVRPNNILIPWL
jgi:hypothetical protein